MRQTAAAVNAQMQEFCQKLFDRVDPLGYDVGIETHGETIWLVRIENATECDRYVVEYNRIMNEWSWMRYVIAS
jgi:hypothetical protein